MPPDTPPESHETWNPGLGHRRADTWHRPEVRPRTSGRRDEATTSPQRYEETGLLGRGGIAEVRSGLDGHLGREVAIKRLQNLNSKVGRERFLREARVTAQLEHPGIVPIYDAGVDEDGVPFYTMRYLRGTALGVALHEAKGLQGRMELLPAFASVCQAMAYAHARGVIHRDLKPDNIMLGEFGEALVVDWGLARTLGSAEVVEEPGESGAPRQVSVEGGPLTVMGQVAGTPAYMAPEQALGQATTPATDVFALGAILYQLLTGSPPHGVADDIHEQLARARTGTIRPVRKRNPYAPPDLAAIAERCLAYHPAQRYPSAAELSKEIERWTSGRFVESYRYSPTEQVARLARLYWLPLLLIGVGVTSVLAVTTIGGAVSYAEYTRAVANEVIAIENKEKAERDLSNMLRDRAELALTAHDGPRARALSARSLALVEAPETRGQLAEAWRRPGLTPLWTFEAPHTCDALFLDGDDLYCGGEGQVSRMGLDGTLRWNATIPQQQVGHLRLESGRLWVGTMEGMALLEADSGTVVGTSPGGFVVSLLPDGDGGVRSSEWSGELRSTVRWNPPGVPIATRYASSSIMDIHRRDGETYRLHAAGYVTAESTGEAIGDAQHVAYSMAPVSDGWVIGGSDATWLHADGTTTRLDTLSNSLGFLRSNERDQVAGITAAHQVLIFDLRTQRLITQLPAVGEGLRPAMDFEDDVLATAHGRRIRGWGVPKAPTTSAIEWKIVEERADGKARVYCGHDGIAELHDLVSGAITPLLHDRPLAKISACGFIDGKPYATWSSKTVTWDEDGQAVPFETPLRSVTDLARLGQVLVVEGDGMVMVGDERVGTGIINRHSDGTITIQDVEGRAVRWLGPVGSGWAVLHEHPLEHLDQRALATLPGYRVVEAARLADKGPSRVLGPDGAVTHLPPHGVRVTAAHALDARWLVTGDQSGTLRLWDLETNELHAEVHAHDARVIDLYVTGEGDEQRLVSESYDQSLHSWSIPILHVARDQVVDRVRSRDQVEFRDGDVRLVDPTL